MSFATLAALGVTGFATTANAALVTITENLPFDSGNYTDIAIDSSTPQFYYDSFKGVTTFGTQNSGAIAAGNSSATIDPTASYASGSEKEAGLAGNYYSHIQLSFENDDGVTEYGYASFTRDGSLKSITYDSVSAVPEPSSWALLIAGAGLTGAVMHRRKRRSLQSALVAA